MGMALEKTAANPADSVGYTVESIPVVDNHLDSVAVAIVDAEESIDDSLVDCDSDEQCG